MRTEHEMEIEIFNLEAKNRELIDDLKCKGENCGTTNGRNHSVECLFEHFMCYTGGHKQPSDIRIMLKKAYFDGHEAGLAHIDKP